MNSRTVDLPEQLLFPEPLGQDAVVGLIGHHPSEIVAAYDLNGSCLWQAELDTPCQMGTVSQKECWLIRRNGLVAFSLDGTCTHQFELSLQSRERIGAIVRHGESLYVSLYRSNQPRPEAVALACPPKGGVLDKESPAGAG